MIRYSLERLYHFNCGECGGWWSIGDFHRLADWSGQLTCPHCKATQSYEPIENEEPFK